MNVFPVVAAIAGVAFVAFLVGVLVGHSIGYRRGRNELNRHLERVGSSIRV